MRLGCTRRLLLISAVILQIGYRVLHAASAEGRWDERFALPGIDGFGFSVTSRGNLVYVGGSFRTAGELPVNNIAMWDGREWHRLGSGLQGGQRPKVSSLVSLGQDLYAGGSFSQAGDWPASNIARWNGVRWTSLGLGLDAEVSHLLVFRHQLVAVGAFLKSGDQDVSQLAVWDGAGWSPLGGGLSGRLLAVTADDKHLYAAGVFSESRVLKWDGTNWSHLPPTPWYPVKLVSSTRGLFALQNQSLSDESSSYRLDRWDGTRWNREYIGFLGAGCCDFYPVVSVFEEFQDQLIMAGDFKSVGRIPIQGIAAWDGTKWSGLGTGLGWGLANRPSVYAVSVEKNVLYFSGYFDSIGGVTARGVAKYDGSGWSPVGTGLGMAGTIQTMARKGTNLWVGGGIESSQGTRFGSLGAWNGATWSLFDGLETSYSEFPSISSVAVTEDSLYAVAGRDGVFRLQGSNWTQTARARFGDGPSGAVLYGLAVHGTNLYLGGYLDSINNVTVNGLARWDGIQWHAVETGVVPVQNPVIVTALMQRDHQLFVSEQGSGTSYRGVIIKKFDGTNWSVLGEKLQGSIRALAWYQGNLVAGGYITAADGRPLRHLARWNGAQWVDVGGGVNAEVHALAVNGHELYVGGSFSEAGDMPANGIAKWNGEQWSAFGDGVEPGGYVEALVAAGDEIFVGGRFRSAGGRPSHNFAIYHVPHALKATLGDKQLRLSWPGTGTNFMVEMSSTLTAESWIPLPQLPAHIGSQLSVQLDINANLQFYRLRRR